MKADTRPTAAVGAVERVVAEDTTITILVRQGADPAMHSVAAWERPILNNKRRNRNILNNNLNNLSSNNKHHQIPTAWIASTPPTFGTQQ